MCADADAAAHVGHDQVEVFVFLADGFGVDAGDGFLVQGVEDGEAFKVLVPGDARDVVHFVHDDGVGDVGFLQPDHLGNAVGDEAAEVAGVHAVVTFQQVLFHQVVDAVNAGGERFDEAAATHHDGDVLKVDILVLQFFQNEVLAIVVLIGKDSEL